MLRTSGISQASPITQHITAQLSHRGQHFLPRTFTTHAVTDHRSSAQPLLTTLFSKAPKSLTNFKRPKGVGKGKRPLPHNVTIWGALDAPTLARVGCFINRCVLLFFLFLFYFFLTSPPPNQCRAPSVRVAMGEEAVYSLY